ncbi:restriction endonuclease subunit R [candidate division KSB1 bacterium]|nr:MAG: restriction endonuclease subunit R [candidate division KSB1 bacterium]
MRLEKYLILNKYLLSLFGVNSISDLRDELKNKKEGFDNDGKSFFVDTLIGLENLRIDLNVLLQYDRAIKEYSEKLSNYRRENIVLKYFQYLAVLFSEIFLDRYFNKKQEFLGELNSFLVEYNKSERIDIPHFEEKDLKKLAYWMATGSGKTLIMHINYWQFLKYDIQPLDNIILVTPNEGLSKQHYNEMQKSGIPCRLYSENPDSLTLYKDQVFIIDIHKLTEEKKGAGVRIETGYFEGRNLVFIDEGHKGQTTEEHIWKKLREDLGKNGFVFEYSATFGQVISEKNKDLLEEYSKAIVFDYSYKYFYEDGYGKDFYVYNLREDSFTKNYNDLILTANLLSFYEQSVLYEEHKGEFREYLVEKPLWAFIGSKVSGKGINSDVLKVVLFLKKIIEDRKFLENNIAKILNGKSGLLDQDGNDIFKDRFQYIRKTDLQINDIYVRLFNANGGTLQLYDLKSADGEIGLKIGEGEYFGVINIGDVSRFRKLLTKSGFEEKQDRFTPSLFERINENNSNINILIGAKKFIEGWDSWRVCSMGLINMGKGEGPQIIQLFGRGVRLKGRNFSLRRSEENNYQIKSLETLNIFGLNADYINSFLETIRKEEVEYEEIKLPIKRLDETKWKNLYTLKTDRDFDFTNHFIELETDEELLRRIKIDIRPMVKIAHGLETTISETKVSKTDFGDYIDLLNWNGIYLKILNYKISKGFFNLRLHKDILQEIIRSQLYEVYAFPEQIKLKSFTDLDHLEEIILVVLKNYIDKFYNYKLRQTETKQLQLFPLVKEDENFSYDYYTLKIEVPKDKKEKIERKREIEKIKKLLKQVDKLYQKDFDEIPTIHFDRHLYTPLVVYDKHKEFIKSEPARLNEGETRFVKKLRDYLKKSKIKDKEIFLLRNLSKRGVKFFQTSGFYPDFIMWVKENSKQTMVFIDPKGILNLSNFNDDKIQLYKSIKEIEKELKINKIHHKLRLESLILSVSKYNEIKKKFGEGNMPKQEFEKRHILFMEDDDLVKKIFQCII